MHSVSLVLATCFFMMVSTTSFAQISATSDKTHITYSTTDPLHYRIASLDPRLNITTQQMIELSKQAAAIWEKDTDQKYFVYDPKADLVIHLVFDQRQVRSMKRSENLYLLEQKQQIWLNQNQQLQNLKDNLVQSATQLEFQKIEYQSNTANYQKTLQKLENSRLHKSLIMTLQQQQQLLKQQSADLQNQIEQHNLLVQQLNNEVEKSKLLHQQLNESVATFNQTFKPQVVHKGQFDGKQIFIYEFSSLDDLRLTLAHEFGHALGLKHTKDPKSLMYPRIKEQDAKNFQLTDVDLELLGFSR
ncbi:matrixin family metalloprotease [Acinetobacter tjernbergiae]|nr:matrixin family metalloprotease [Acinetobacter tjernbergiae]